MRASPFNAAKYVSEVKRNYKIHRLAHVMLPLLAARFVIGITLQTFTYLPSYPGNVIPYSAFPMVLLSNPLVLLHGLLGLALLVLSIAAAVQAIMFTSRYLKLMSLLGLLIVIIVTVAGAFFVHYAFKEAIYSYIMTLGFLAALLVYFSIFHVTDKGVMPTQR